MAKIELVGGRHSAEIDDCDNWVASYRWYEHRVKGSLTVYAKAYAAGDTLYMHRIIMRPIPDGMIVDHIDRNGLNNRKANLRLLTAKQNQHAWFQMAGWEHIHHVKSKGRSYFYHRPTKTRLPDDPDSAEFHAMLRDLNSAGTQSWKTL